MEQKASARGITVPFPCFRMDSLGALVLDMGTNQLAMAGIGQLFRQDNQLDPVV